jgi:hypothetical protein
MSDKRISQLVERVTIANNDVLPIVALNAATTNKVTISTIQDWMQTHMDLGVTSISVNTSTSGSDISISGSPITSTGTITINIPTASATKRGALSSADWSTFNGKQDVLTFYSPLQKNGVSVTIDQADTDTNGYLSFTDWNTFNNKQAALTKGNLTETISGVLTITGGTAAVIGTGTTIEVKQASGSQDGFLDSADWTTFNNKVSTSRSIGTTAPLQGGGDLSANRTLSITQSGSASNGYLSSTDWNTFNNKQNALSGTGVVKSTAGTISYINGLSTQYIDGTGSLQTFPSIISDATNLIREVYNETGATLTKGTVVYINGGHGNLPTIGKALATGDSTSAQTYGVVRSDIGNMSNGYIVVVGDLIDISTNGYTIGTQLYLSSTTAGEYTSTKQYAPAHLVYVGIVTRSHPTQGVIAIKIQNGYEMDELHDVSAQNPSNNDILQFKTATNLWTKVAGSTTNIAEGTNLYYTDARSRGAFSESVTGLDYNSTTGVLSTTAGYGIPTTASQSNWDAAYNDKINSAAVTGTTTKTLTLTQQDGGTITASWTDINTDAVSSVFGRTGAVVAVSGDYTTAQVTESGNLYFTNGRARSAISLTTTGSSGAATYTEATGVFNIPSYTLVGLGGEPTITAGTTAQYWRGDKSWQTLNTANVPELTNLYFTDARARAAISLTTTGTSGVASYTAGVLNIPNYTYTLPTASTTVLGGVKVDGTTITINGSGVISGANTYSLPIATASVLGGVKIGSGVSIDAGGVISVSTSYQAPLNGTGFVKATGTTISYDNSTYLTTTAAGTTYVPYTGATGAVNLGSNTIRAGRGEIISTGGSDAVLYFADGTYNAGIGLNYGTNPNQMVLYFNSITALKISTTGAGTFNNVLNVGTNLNAQYGYFAQDIVGDPVYLRVQNLNTGGYSSSMALSLYGYSTTAYFDVLKIRASYPAYGKVDFLVKNQSNSADVSALSILGTGAASFISTLNIGGVTDIQSARTPQLTLLKLSTTTLSSDVNDEISIDLGRGGMSKYSGRISGYLSNYSTYDGGLKFYTSAAGTLNTTPAITVTSLNKIGLGITNPSYTIGIKNQQYEDGLIPNYYPTTIGGTFGQVVIHSYYVVESDGLGAYPRYLDIANIGAPDDSNGGSNIRFLTNGIVSGTGAVERVRITSRGYMGIGNASPQARLDLGGGYGANGEKFLIYSDNNTGALAGTKVGFYMDRFGLSNNSTFVFPTYPGYEGTFIIASKNTGGTTLIDRFTVRGESGNVGIGTNAPNYLLDLKRSHAAGYGSFVTLINLNGFFPGYDVDARRAGISAGVPNLGNTTYGWIGFETRGADGYNNRMVINGNGNVMIGTTTDYSYRLYVVGSIYASGDVIAYSDVRIKTNIRPIENALEKITNSRGVIYDRTDTNDKDNIGFIAQELEKQFPELVSTDNQGRKGVKYQNAVAVLFEAIKEQQKQINDLKNRN